MSDEANSSALLDYAFARGKGVLLTMDGETPHLAALAEADPLAVLEARRLAGGPVLPTRLDRADFDRRLSEVYARQAIDARSLDEKLEQGGSFDGLVAALPESADLLDAAGDAPVIGLINGLIAEAVRRRASDIHVEPFENRLLIRFRIDGVLGEALELPARVANLLASRIKVMARLDITERRLPQDGRISLAMAGRSFDVRVSTLPARHGERVVLRVLDKGQGHVAPEALGMGRATLAAFRAALAEPNGILLVTGPTGSGKTTTLYAGLGELNDRSRNILTVEDPVEYALEGVGQTQVNARVGMTFAAGLRAILRQDPDVVMIGEIRDAETAGIAVQASLTGHLVLSTVHTNSAVAAVTRLRDMGIEPFLLASTLKAVFAQRLVRRLCAGCRERRPTLPAERALFGADAPGELWHPVGCAACHGNGHDGRIGLYEVAVIDETMRRLILDLADEDRLAAHAFADSETLFASGLGHVAAGLTSLDEVLRVCRHGAVA